MTDQTGLSNAQVLRKFFNNDQVTRHTTKLAAFIIPSRENTLESVMRYAASTHVFIMTTDCNLKATEEEIAKSWIDYFKEHKVLEGLECAGYITIEGDKFTLTEPGVELQTEFHNKLIRDFYEITEKTPGPHELWQLYL